MRSHAPPLSKVGPVTLLAIGMLSVLVPTALLRAETAPHLRIGDVVKVTVVDEPEISGDFTVSPEGTFHMKYLEEAVPAVGKTAKALSDTIVSLLKPDYLLNPQVLVELANKNMHRCAVLGQVKAPREIPFDPDEGMTLQGALGRAGETTEDADPRRIEITREGKTIPAPMPESRAMRLRNGDAISVPKLPLIGTYQLTGEAKRGGEYEIPRGKAPSLRWAIDNGGGIAPTGKIKGTEVIRGATRIEIKTEADLESQTVRPGDIIKIKQRTF